MKLKKKLYMFDIFAQYIGIVIVITHCYVLSSHEYFYWWDAQKQNLELLSYRMQLNPHVLLEKSCIE